MQREGVGQLAIYQTEGSLAFKLNSARHADQTGHGKAGLSTEMIANPRRGMLLKWE